MEALRTQNDNLRWEIQRLDVENRRLRENNPEASRSLDREAQLERAKCDIDELTDRAQASERRVAEYTETVERAERRAADAEDRVTELEQQLTDQRVLADPCRDDEDEGADADRVRELRRELQKSEERFVEAETGVRRLTEELQHLQRSSAEEKEAVLQQAELSRYRVLEEERRKCEDRER